VKLSNLSRGRLVWLVVTAAILGVTTATVFGTSLYRWEHPELLFMLSLGAALTCVVAATVAIAVADRKEIAEIGLLGSGLMGASVMPLVHGLTTPGVIYEETAAFEATAFLTIPIAVLCSAPLLRPHSGFGRWASRRWRDWTLLSLVGVFVLAAAIVVAPNAISVPGPRDPLTIAVSVGMVVAIVAMSLRQLRYYELGGQGVNLVASISLVMLAAAAMLPLSTMTYDAAFWWMHTAGAFGVFGVCGSMVLSKRLSRSTHDLLSPILVRDPLVAFELGLSPTVHRFVSALADKDEITRDHVVRTGEMAVRVGERFNLSARRLRNLGLGAMLHDVGKVSTPDEILMKPARLTPGEYDVIKLHPLDGETMLASEPTLAAVAPIVRSHHERMDGGGYPDGLTGRDIPLESRIIAVCDAFDAMTHDRPYRRAMSHQMAFAVLREHSGSQWDPMVIDQVIAVLPSMPTVSSLDAVGREAALGLGSIESSTIEDLAGLADVIDIEELLETVDAEI